MMSSKIRRQVLVNGVKTWIAASTEQDYAEKVSRLLAPSPVTRDSVMLRDYAKTWFRSFALPNVTESTAITYERQLNLHIYPVIGDMAMDKIGSAEIQDLFNRMGDASQQTKNKVRIVLSQIFKMAVEDRIIVYNPMTSIALKIKGPAAVAIEPYSVAEMRYFVSHISDVQLERDRAWFALSLCLPLRPEEVLGLRWRDVDLSNRVIHIRSTVSHPSRNEAVFRPYTKTEASVRDLIIPEGAIAYLPPKGEPDEFVVGGSEPLSYTMVRRMRNRIANQIDYDGTITPRRFRTTVATDISAKTHDLKLVQRMLGHATPQMTLKHYDKGRQTAVNAEEAISECYGF